MKNVLFWILALLMLMSVPALAEVAQNTVTNDRLGAEATGINSDSRLSELLNLSRKKSGRQAKMSARARAIANAAQTLGFQEGFRNEYEKLLDEVSARRADLDKIFDFRRLLIDGKVLPPVIRWSGPAMELKSDTDAVAVEAQYRIEAPARLVMAAPSYMDYLQASTEVLQPANEILPADASEKEVWQEAVIKGWSEGAAHARTVMEMAFDRLVSDYRGILRFKMLADQGLVSVPILAKGDLGIQISDDILSVDQKIFRITLPASFRHVGNK